MNRIMTAVLPLLAMAGGLGAQSLDVPVTVQERAGVRRTAEPVTFGVPLPKGLLRENERLRLYGPDGKPVPAAFHAASRWWEDAAGRNSSCAGSTPTFSPTWPRAAEPSTTSRSPKKPSPRRPPALEVKTKAATSRGHRRARFTVHRPVPSSTPPGCKRRGLAAPLRRALL